MSRDLILVTESVLSLDALLRELGHDASGSAGVDDEAGALVTFSGIVRRMEKGEPIPALDYEHYAGMAEKEITRLVEEAHRRWPLRRIGVIHRVGRVPVGEPSVIIAVSSGHRAEAFDAARFLIDELKKSVPIWKVGRGE